VFTEEEDFIYDKEYMFEGVQIIEDVSQGQRGYLRNQEGLLTIMLKNLERYKKKGD
jgi:hypothetical protein